MSKEGSMFRRLGNGIRESIGVRESESVLPEYGQGSPARRDYKVDRSTGEIEITKIFSDPDQPRKNFDPEALERLADDIKKRGQLQAIGVRWNEESSRWVIIYGERRWRAMQLAKIDTIKCRFFLEPIEEKELRSIALVENLQREQLKPLEEAVAYRDLMAVNSWKAKEVSEYLNISPTKISRALKLLELPEEVQAKVDSGDLAPSTAYQVAKEKRPEKRDALIAQAVAGTIDEAAARKATTRTRNESQGGIARRSTNETFIVTHGIRVTVAGRKAVGEHGVLESLLEAVEQQRAKIGKRAA
jgi:ParB family transcriptional regulator, chromosome partitioning protein